MVLQQGRSLAHLPLTDWAHPMPTYLCCDRKNRYWCIFWLQYSLVECSAYPATAGGWIHMYSPSIIEQSLCWASGTCCPRPFGCITAGLLWKLQACRFYRLSQGRAEFLRHTFKFSYQQPPGVNPVTDLAEACSPFALFITDSPRLSLSKITFIFFQFGSCWFARGLL